MSVPGNAPSAALRAVALLGFSLASSLASPAFAGGGAAFRYLSSPSAVDGFSTAELIQLGQSSMLAVGPVESIDLVGGAVTVLGQRFTVSSTSMVRSASSTVDLRSLATGIYAAAAGEWSGEVLQLKELRLSSVPYVAGASRVVLRGLVKSVDQKRGQAQVGNAVVDYTAALANGSGYQPSAESILETLGVQPAFQGAVLADGVAWEERATTKRGISGGDFVAARGISGGDFAMKRGISGGDFTSARGISGGDMAAKRGISGGDIRGISGGDLMMKRGISGGDFTSARGISGGDFAMKRGISGGDFTSARGISGGDFAMKRGISGGDLMAVRGISGGDALER